MPLKHFYKSFYIEPKTIENSEFLIHNRNKMGEKLYGMAKRVFTQYITEQDENYSGGYFHFGMILGNSGQASKRDVDYLWRRMKEVFGESDESYDIINRVLGTICMMCVASDSRPWVYRDDMDRQEKLDNNEIPDANEYFIGNYKIRSRRQRSEEEILQDRINKLKRKFNSKK
jgi:hypothetical protein